MTTLADQRLDARDEADLRWFFNEADGAMGLGSNFEGMVRKIQAPMSHGNTGGADIAEHRIDAAFRERRIRRVLELVPAEHHRTLRISFTAPLAKSTEATQLKRYGDLGPLILDSPVAAQVHARSRSQRPLLEWLERIARSQASSTAKSQAAEVRRAAELQLVRAGRAYAEARRLVDRRRVA